MGLKTIAFAQFKTGKTVLALTMAELGPVGFADTEGRLEWLTRPHPTIAPRAWPYDCPVLPRTDNDACKNNPILMAALSHRNPIYLIRSKVQDEIGKAIQTWGKDGATIGNVVDSGSILWDFQVEAHDAHALDMAGGDMDKADKMSMLAWSPVKRGVRRFLYTAERFGAHFLVTAHVQEKGTMVKADGETKWQVTGRVPWLEKKTPHYVDLVVSLASTMGKPWPTLTVFGEGLMGSGGLVRGAKIENPTFGELVRRLQYVPSTVALDPEDAEARNLAGVERVKGAPRVAGIDDADSLRNPKRRTTV